MSEWRKVGLGGLVVLGILAGVAAIVLLLQFLGFSIPTLGFNFT